MAKYKVTLTKAERSELDGILSKGYHTSQQFKNACILLNVDEGKYSDESSVNREICKVLKIGMRTIDRVKKKFVEDGLEAILERKTPDREYARIADGEVEAKLIALSCSESPTGYARWSLRLLADKAVELGYVERLSYETVRRVLKKTNLNPGK